jgi:rSAM/selenodomain-associated transferase 1
LRKDSADCLILFAKPPIPGRVKTRLIPAIGAVAAARLYRQLLEWTLTAGNSLSGVHKQLWWDGDDDGSGRDYAERYGMSLQRQRGANLGERMAHALAVAFRSAERAVLIGSDCPETDSAYLRSAFAALTRCDAIVGPAADGGYLLIGMRRPEGHLFTNIPWSSGKVLELTRQRLSELDWRWEELPGLRDIDEAVDLAHFPTLTKSILR